MMMGILGKLIPKNIAGILGVVQVLIPLLRELVIVVLRIAAVLMPQTVTDDLINTVVDIAEKVESGFDTIKRFLLGLPTV